MIDYHQFITRIDFYLILTDFDVTLNSMIFLGNSFCLMNIKTSFRGNFNQLQASQKSIETSRPHLSSKSYRRPTLSGKTLRLKQSDGNSKTYKSIGKALLDTSNVTKKNQKQISATSFRTRVHKRSETFQIEKAKTNNGHKLEKKYYWRNLKAAVDRTLEPSLANEFKSHFEEVRRAVKTTQFLHTYPKIQLNLQKKAQHKLSVILDLDQTLVHYCKDATKGSVQLDVNFNQQNSKIGINIRPHLFQFLEELSRFAEIIIFTASSSAYADAVCDYLDPQKKYFSYRLYRQHCKLEKQIGAYVKDLRILNRNLSETVLVDNSAYSYCLQLENGIPIIPYEDCQNDNQLMELLEYLKEINEQGDVRICNKRQFKLHTLKLMNKTRHHIV